MKVAIITVNYNGKKDTLEFLGSLKKLKTEDCKLKTVVVDNGSTDGLVGELVKNYPEVEVLQNGENKGFAGGYNRGLEYAQIWGADYFLLINNDCLIKDINLLKELINTIEPEKNIGLASPKIYFAPGFEFHKDRYKKADLGKVIWYAGGHFDWDNIRSVHRGIDEVDKDQYNRIEEVDFVSGACMLIKKEVLEKVGLFDEKYFLYFEDADFIKRVKDAGYKIFYNGKVSVFHKVSQSTGVGSAITDYYHTRNRLIFGMKYGKLRTKIALLREAFKLFLFGRIAQKKGILDFYLGISGNYLEVASLFHPKGGRKLSIGIVNYNTANLTKKLLLSIFQKESGFDEKDMEVIVLDNGSDDNCKNVIKDFLGKIKFIQNQENKGFSKGYNKIIKYSKGEYFLMFNSDIEVLKGSLSEMLKAANDQAVFGGKLVFPDRSAQDSAFHLPTIPGAFKEYFLGQKGSYFMYEPSGSKPSKVEGLVMACYLIPRHIINKVGLLDEGTFIYFEDIEYARRLKKFGIPIYFVPSAKFIHHHGAASKTIGVDKSQELLQKAAIHYHGRFYYFLLSWVLKIGQKLGRVKTPVSRWTKVLTS